ncbi:unnamed protein product [Prorocentrum cordatum]|uniref:Uncharacterized protein n=1 Tax=Prorocentrum cordatum TaxID=2364126 RepID=A0ABN9QSU3_9DINO|nr:unnamed protein product [Polarella glacialis]
MLLSLSGPLLEFYVHVDLAISAAPFSQLSTHLLKKGSPCLASEGLASVGDPGLLPITASLRSFFKNWVERLQVLVEVRPAEFKGRASLASIILGIETLPSEPALLKSHLNRMHSQRHAILSLVESVDLVKKGQTTSTSQRTLVDFLSSAIKSLTSEEDESSKATVTDVDARDQRDDAEAMAEGLGASKYLLRFLEYLAKVADLMRSASTDAQARKTKKTQEVKKHKPKEGHIKLAMNAAAEDRAGEGSCDGLGELPEEDVEVTKLFDVLAESPKGIVARLLFELGGHRQALALSEVMNVDLVQVIVNSSAVLPVWTPQRGEAEGHRLRDPGTARSRYPLSMEVVHYLAQHETALPQVRCPEAPLLATMACLERRGKRWPSWKMLHFAKGQSDGRFPSLHRWAEDLSAATPCAPSSGPTSARRAPGSPGPAPRSRRRGGPPARGRRRPPRAASWTSSPPAAARRAGGRGLRGRGRGRRRRLRTRRLQRLFGGADAAPRRRGPPRPGGGRRRPRGGDERRLHEVGARPQHGAEVRGGVAGVRRVPALRQRAHGPGAAPVPQQHPRRRGPRANAFRGARRAAGPRVHAPAQAPHAGCAIDAGAAQALGRGHSSADSVDVPAEIRAAAHTDGTEVHSLKLELKRILRKMVTFEKILQVSGGRWRVWQEIEDMDKAQVSEAVAHLMSLEQHDLARTLTQMYGMTDPLHSLELSRLHYLFTTKNDKTSAVSRLLSFPPQQAVSFALQLLDILRSCRVALFCRHRVLLCQMLLERLHSWLSADEDQPPACAPRRTAAPRRRQRHGAAPLPARAAEARADRRELADERTRRPAGEPFLADFPQYRHDALILRYARKALALQAAALLCLPAEDEEASLSPLEDGRVPGAAAGVGAADCAGTGLGGKWCLTGSPSEDLEDRRIREEHVFEAAPSIGLAEQILELCSDSPENAASCFAICDELSLRLRDLAPHHSLGPPRWERGVRRCRPRRGRRPLCRRRRRQRRWRTRSGRPAVQRSAGDIPDPEAAGLPAGEIPQRWRRSPGAARAQPQQPGLHPHCVAGHWPEGGTVASLRPRACRASPRPADRGGPTVHRA